MDVPLENQIGYQRQLVAIEESTCLRFNRDPQDSKRYRNLRRDLQLMEEQLHPFKRRARIAGIAFILTVTPLTLWMWGTILKYLIQ